MKPKKVAIIAEWLTWRGGAESVVDALLEAFPEADLFTTAYNDKKLPEYKSKHPRVSFLDKIPVVRHKHQLVPPLLLKAIESLDLSGYDLIISSSSAIGKGIKKPKNCIHVCYCHTPMRYVWQPELDNRLVRIPFGKFFLNYLKKWDLKSNKSVDYFLTNSNFTKDRIRRCYNREAEVIYPPVDIEDKFKISKKSDFYLCLGRLIPYKMVDLAVQACNELGKQLIVAGDGPDSNKLKSEANENIKFTGRVSNSQKNDLLQKAKALIFPAEEDFGIVPVESMSHGTPVIAYSKGGVIESVIDKKTGIFFNKQTVSSLKEAIREFEKTKFDTQKIRDHSLGFSKSRFINEIKDFIYKI
jgi:glycosyltransferase involved in cell wall biosynthesis